MNRRMNLTSLPLDASPSNETLVGLILSLLSQRRSSKTNPSSVWTSDRVEARRPFPLKIAREQLF